ncbi:MAG TPA: dipeptide epimerase, partial [Alphaproteobacteria bacterium]|nr:dipeptide epimerase [Alphaproteobacteria bacterium]
MHISVETFTVQKRFPLTISRGTTSQTTNLWVRIEEQGTEGWGEGSPFAIALNSHTTSAPKPNLLTSIETEVYQSTGILFEALDVVAPMLEAFSPWERQKIERVLAEAEVPSAAWASIDLALYDWLGKQVGLPLWRLWGLNRR